MNAITIIFVGPWQPRVDGRVAAMAYNCQELDLEAFSNRCCNLFVGHEPVIIETIQRIIVYREHLTPFTAAQPTPSHSGSACDNIYMYTVAVCVTTLWWARLLSLVLSDVSSSHCKSSQTQTSWGHDRPTQYDLDPTVLIHCQDHCHRTREEKERQDGYAYLSVTDDENAGGDVSCTEIQSLSTARGEGLKLLAVPMCNDSATATRNTTQADVVQEAVKSECSRVFMRVNYSPEHKLSKGNSQRLKGRGTTTRYHDRVWNKLNMARQICKRKANRRCPQISPERFGHKHQKYPDSKKKKLTDFGVESSIDGFPVSFTDLHGGPDVCMMSLFRPDITALPIQRDMSSELARVSTFGLPVSRTWLSRLPPSVWILRLAQTGFYLTQEENIDSVLRCAFCDVVVRDISQFSHEQPMDVHRRLAPNCPLVTAKDTTNLSLDHAGQMSGQAFIQAMFDPARKSPVSPPRMTESHRSSSGISPSAQYQLPPPRQLSEQRLTTAVASQASARHQPLSLPAIVNTDCHQSDPTSLQHTSRSASSVGESREQSATHMLTHLSAVMATNQSSPPTSVPTSTAQVTSAHNAPPQTPLAQSALPQSSVQTPMAQSAQFEPSALNSNTQTSSQSQPSAQTTPPPARSSTQVPPHQSQAPIQTSTSAQDESSSSENASSTSNPTRQVVTYSQLGIYTQQPKRPDMVVQSIRCGTFTGWPHSRTHTPEEMSEAGFYYTGHNDLARCFYCKGGLKSWAGHLRPWVEHARFFPECPYVNQVKGRVYIEAVQALHTESEAVSEQQVEAEMARRNKTTHVQQNAETTTSWKDEGGAVGGAVGGASEPVGESYTDDFLRDAEPEDITKRVEELEITIHAEKKERICKICWSNEVNILFLPCGHLVSCAHCAPALRTCAVCRQTVKGRVRVYMSEEEP